MDIKCCTKNDFVKKMICDRVNSSVKNTVLGITLCVELVLGVLYFTDLTVWVSRYILWGLFGVYCLVALYKTLSRSNFYPKSFYVITAILIGIGTIDYFSTGRNMFLKMTVILLAIGGGTEKSLVLK